MQEPLLDSDPSIKTATEKAKPTGTAITFRPNEELKAKLEQVSQEDNQSINQWLTTHLTRYFSEEVTSVHDKLDLILNILEGKESPAENTAAKLPYDPAAFERLDLSEKQMREKREQADWEKVQEAQRKLAQNRNAYYSLASPISPTGKTRNF